MALTDSIGAILYELQPIRIQDLIFIVHYVIAFIVDITTALIKALKHMIQFMIFDISLFSYILALIWLGVWYGFVLIEFGSLWVVISLFALIFLNLGTRAEGELSAYSVFNKRFTKLLGTTTVDQFEQEIRHAPLETQANNFIDPDILDHIDQLHQRNHPQQRPPGHVPIKRGKKARRTYEQRLLKREARAMNELQISDDSD